MNYIQRLPPSQKKVLLVSAFPDANISAKTGKVFDNPSSKQLTQELVGAGISSFDILPTYIFTLPPPKGAVVSSIIKVNHKNIEFEGFTNYSKLSILDLWYKQFLQFVEYVKAVNPDLIIALDQTALLMLSQDEVKKKYKASSIGLLQKYRGSLLQLNPIFSYDKAHILFPMYHKAQCYASQDIWMPYSYDLRKAALFYRYLRDGKFQELFPKYDFLISTNYGELLQALLNIVARLELETKKVYLSVDIETLGFPAYIDCIGIAESHEKAICIPFTDVKGKALFSLEQELEIIKIFQLILKHRNAELIGQNFNYDSYFLRTRYCIHCIALNDTETSFHTLFPTEKKSLAFMSSLFLPYYTFWKDDAKEGEDSIPVENEVRWRYNCLDTTATFAVWSSLEKLWEKERFSPNGNKRLEAKDFQLRQLPPPLTDMQARGVKIDLKKREMFRHSLEQAANSVEAAIFAALGYRINLSSSSQVGQMLYYDLGLTPPKTTKESVSGLPTSEEAILLLQEEYPILSQFLAMITEYRSLKVFLNTFINAKLGRDSKIYTTYKINGTTTFRFASTKNPDKQGANLQNIPKGGKTLTGFPLPNIRDLMIVDNPEYEVFIDIDLDSADLRCVAALSECKLLTKWLSEGKKPYVEVAKIYYKDDTITKNHPSYKLFKALCHALHYKGSPFNIAKKLGLPTEQVVALAAWYFKLMPEIPQWHKEIDLGIKRGFIMNPFGYKLTFTDKGRPTIAQQACAWIPQSTVGIVINKGIVNAAKLDSRIVRPVMQVHDSCVLIGDKRVENLKGIIEDCFKIEVPFKTPIIIPAEAIIGGTSWGSCS